MFPVFFLLCLLLIICPWMSHIASLKSSSFLGWTGGAQDLSQLEHCCAHVWAMWPQAHPPQYVQIPTAYPEMLPWSWCLSWRIRPKGLLGPDDKGKKTQKQMKNVRCWLAGRRQSSRYLCGERRGMALIALWSQTLWQSWVSWNNNNNSTQFKLFTFTESVKSRQ